MSTNTAAGIQTPANDSDRTDPVEELDFTPKTGRRAVYEAWSFEQTGDIVRIRNQSHADTDEHVYTVELDSRGVPTRCTCPAYEYHCDPGEMCKHGVAVALHHAQIEDVAVVADGGQVVPDVAPARDDEESLELVDTGAGCLVFKQLTEERNGRTVVVAKRLLGYLGVEDWDAIEDAVRNRGHSAGDVLHLPEFETIDEARAAAGGEVSA